MVKKDKKKEDISGLFIPAGVLIGLGVGMALEQTAAGTLIGLGLGFLAMAVFKLLKPQK